MIQRLVRDIEDCNLEPLHKGSQLKAIVHIGWKRLREEWIKLNSDGACKDLGRIVRCGGLFCDTNGKWINGYAKKIGVCGALHVEIWGIVLGLGNGLEGTIFSPYSGKRLEESSLHDLRQF